MQRFCSLLNACVYVDFENRTSNGLPIFSRYRNCKAIRPLKIRIGEIPEARADNDNLAILGAARERDLFDLHIRPAKSLNTIGSWSNGHGPTNGVVRQRVRLRIPQAVAPADATKVANRIADSRRRARMCGI